MEKESTKGKGKENKRNKRKAEKNLYLFKSFFKTLDYEKTCYINPHP